MSNSIEKIDKNFTVVTPKEGENICFFDADGAPFKVYGLMRENGRYCRMPDDIAKNTSEGVDILHTNTAGGRVRFMTDSLKIRIKAEMFGVGKMPHFALSGSIGFDLYADDDGSERYTATFMPPFDIKDGYQSEVSLWELGERKMRTVTINFPTYSCVKKLYIGLDSGALVGEPKPYKIEKPIVYYGSSITQGGCTSRPGNTYQAIISRLFDCDHVNLGFSGNAKGEKTMADYIAGLEMSAFVYDYDHNAPTVEHLKSTHKPMFDIIRAKNPELPIIMMTRPKYHLNDDEKARRAVVEETYKSALDAGDKNVYYIPGNELIDERFAETALVDNCHPNDSGFVSMAYRLAETLKKVDSEQWTVIRLRQSDICPSVK